MNSVSRRPIRQTFSRQMSVRCGGSSLSRLYTLTFHPWARSFLGRSIGSAILSPFMQCVPFAVRCKGDILMASPILI